MPAPNRSGGRHALVSLDWWPGRCLLSSIVPRVMMRANAAGQLLLTGDTVLERGVSTYADWDLRDMQFAAQCADWTFSHISSLPHENDTMEVFWSPPIPGAGQMGSPAFVETLAQEWWTSEDYSWPNVLLDLRIILDQKSGNSTGLGVNLTNAVDRGAWRQGRTLPSDVRVREYVSATPPPQYKIATDVPVTTSIKGDYYGQPVVIPDCLHPLITLTSKASSDATIFDATPDADRGNTGNTLQWEATNHQTWIEHVFVNFVEQRDGLWVRTEKTVVPPRLPDLVYL